MEGTASLKKFFSPDSLNSTKISMVILDLGKKLLCILCISIKISDTYLTNFLLPSTVYKLPSLLNYTFTQVLLIKCDLFFVFENRAISSLPRPTTKHCTKKKNIIDFVKWSWFWKFAQKLTLNFEEKNTFAWRFR